jgi:chromosome segregation ATPase
MDEQKLAEVKKERDHMSNQNVEREKELKAMDEKLAVIKNQCRRGERDYDDKLREIEVIRAKLAADEHKLNELSSIDVRMKQCREEIHKMQKELLTLKAERAAMEEELQIPINIHRWTLLESTDPARFEKLKRYQELQADLVERTREVAALQDQIKEKETEYQELQVQLRRKPGIEVEQRVAEFRGKAKSEKFSLDQITVQLDMYREAVKEYRKELSDAQANLISQRNQWLRQKKRDIKQRQALQEQQQVLDDLGLNIQLT